ncbi:MAG: biotin transporter BioY [Flavobacteriales bacterium]|nr:biotin transporter BioY [Flavobacteriales bacterium]
MILIAPLSISVYEIPFTLQTLIIFANIFFFREIGFYAVLAYVVVGFVGLPVWSGYRSDTHILHTVSAGFVIGFLVVSALLLILVKKKPEMVFWQMAYSLCAAHITLLIFAFCYNEFMNLPPLDLEKLFVKFVPVAMVKSLLAAGLVYAIKSSSILPE